MPSGTAVIPFWLTVDFGQPTISRSLARMRTRHGPSKLPLKILQGGGHLTPSEGSSLPTRRRFLRTAAGAGLALAGSPLTAWADHHGHPTPNSITYLDRRMYI